VSSADAADADRVAQLAQHDYTANPPSEYDSGQGCFYGLFMMAAGAFWFWAAWQSGWIYGFPIILFLSGLVTCCARLRE